MSPFYTQGSSRLRIRAPVASWAASLAQDGQDAEPVGADHLASMRKAVLLTAAPKSSEHRGGNSNPKSSEHRGGNRAAGGDGSRVERG